VACRQIEAPAQGRYYARHYQSLRDDLTELLDALWFASDDWTG
jgi:hypothetical protein